MRCLPITVGLTPLFFAGCKSDQIVFSSSPVPFSSSPISKWTDLSVADQSSTVLTPNIFYEFEHGPGCNYFLSESEHDYFGSSGLTNGWTKVLVVNGRFPPPAEMLEPVEMLTPATIPTLQSSSPLGYEKRDLTLLDDTGVK